LTFDSLTEGEGRSGDNGSEKGNDEGVLIMVFEGKELRREDDGRVSVWIGSDGDKELDAVFSPKNSGLISVNNNERQL
jgi:hypothetical protein